MQNPSTEGRHSAYYDAVTQADVGLEEALDQLRAEQAAHSITPAEAAAQRIELLERHLELCQQARLEHLGGTP